MKTLMTIAKWLLIVIVLMIVAAGLLFFFDRGLFMFFLYSAFPPCNPYPVCF